jgi:hypothetical protein
MINNLTAYIPKHYKARLPDLGISDKAVDYLQSVCTEYKGDETDMVKAVAQAAATFLAGGYMKNPWFQSHPVHTFCAAQIRNKGAGVDFMVVLAVNVADRLVLHPEEVTLPEGYEVTRVIQETIVEEF